MFQISYMIEEFSFLDISLDLQGKRIFQETINRTPIIETDYLSRGIYLLRNEENGQIIKILKR